MDDQKVLLTGGINKFQDRLSALYDIMDTDVPALQIQIEEKKLKPEFSDVTVNGAGYVNTSKKEGISVQRMLEVPESLLIIIATVAGSLLFRQFMWILLPAGFGISSLFAFNKLKRSF